ncbi:polyprenyl synthetase family protein [Mycolicibacterium lacusdiani]|uniref:polyprenyl synthetase family protein n=1 Tax=Mycolicibacterium lacusdiani TaxID=2895283 RepID=UPI001F480348|nr:polyprenyl synthetase family protein [Mycolicibacterium lacusdiani]
MSDNADEFLTALERRLHASVTDAVVTPLRSIDDGLTVFAEHCSTAVTAGGKRLRPRFAYWAWRAGSSPGEDQGPIVRLAAALEMLHAAILVHDDVIDGSELRRGEPSVRAALAGRHQGQSWFGGSASFGDHTALLVGDLLWSAAHDEFDAAATAVLPEHRGRLTSIFRAMRVEVLAGQLLELSAQAARHYDAATAERILRYKTSAYTVERPMELGLALAGPSASDAGEILGVYAGAVGRAFQLRDDLADLFGSFETSGKRVGDDVRDGKPTELLGTTLELAGAADVQTLAGIVGDSTADASAIAEARRIVWECGAAERVSRRIADLVADADRAVEDLPPGVDASSRVALRELLAECTDVSFLGERPD